jgi:hypothetical protein
VRGITCIRPLAPAPASRLRVEARFLIHLIGNQAPIQLLGARVLPLPCLAFPMPSIPMRSRSDSPHGLLYGSDRAATGVRCASSSIAAMGLKSCSAGVADQRDAPSAILDAAVPMPIDPMPRIQGAWGWGAAMPGELGQELKVAKPKRMSAPRRVHPGHQVRSVRSHEKARCHAGHDVKSLMLFFGCVASHCIQCRRPASPCFRWRLAKSFGGHQAEPVDPRLTLVE